MQLVQLLFPAVGEPVLLAVNAAAVFLQIQAQGPGLFLSRFEPGAEVVGDKLHPVFLPHLGPDLTHQLPILIGRDEQGGGEVGEAPLGGGFGGLLEAAGIAPGAPLVRVGGHGGGELPQAVVVHLHERQVDVLGVLAQGVPPGLVLQKGVNVGVVPEAGGGNALLPELLDAPHRAGGAADVK